MMSDRLSPGQIAQIACLFEVTAQKPGNIHRYRDFQDSHFVDYLLSATAIAGPLDRAGEIGVGAAILQAVEATRRVVATNTNLGMILLLAPLAAVPEGMHLAEGVVSVVRGTTVEDARFVYQAIRLARPAGLGTVAEQDVAGEPTSTLYEAMRLAGERDLIARQYVNGYADVLNNALPALGRLLDEGQSLETAIIGAFLTLLASHPDTLIERKKGREQALEALRRAQRVLASGWPAQPESARHYAELDAWLRAEGNGRNPGATADLVAAALFAALRDGTITLPRPGGPAGWSEVRTTGRA
ncbi:MAG: triphosphoribosyl-dephospho-CoA synthase [Isosphaeraceae bacterium]|nr:triphosphoribosyl-dephospho-CoA synthase [Isosphaeraceae bacterium]